MSQKTITLPIPEGLAESAVLLGGPTEVLNDEQARQFILDELAKLDVDGKTVCMPIPDGTRSGPHGVMIQAAYDAIADRAKSITILIALGTHAAMDEPIYRKAPGCSFRNHRRALPQGNRAQP